MDKEINLHYLNAKRDVDHSYWNSLLTLNGILITVFTAFSFFSDAKITTSLIVVISIIDCWLIIKNFKISQYVYNKLGTPSNDQKFLNMSEKEIEAYYNPTETNKLLKKITRNEKIVSVIFYIQMIIIILLLLNNIINSNVITTCNNLF